MPNRLSVHPRWLKRLFSPMIARGRRFARADEGTTAIEFALLGLPFFTLVFAIIETTMVFFAGQVLDSAVQDASRLVRTGQAQAVSMTGTAFRDEICKGLYNMFKCSDLQVKVSKVSDFSSASVVLPTKPCPPPATTCDWEPSWVEYTPGARQEVVMVQAYYKWPLLVVLPWFNFKNQPDNYRLIGAVRVFRNEPF